MWQLGMSFTVLLSETPDSGQPVYPSSSRHPLTMLGTVRAAVRSAARPRAARSSRGAAAAAQATTPAAPLPLGLLPPHPRTVSGNAHLARRSSAASGYSRRVTSRGGTRPLPRGCTTRAAGAGLSGRSSGAGEATAAAAGSNGDDGESSSSSDSSDSSDEENGEGVDDPAGGGAAERGVKAGGEVHHGSTHRRAGQPGRDAEGGTATGRGRLSLKDQQLEEEEEEEEEEYDYRSVGSEIFEGGDLEAGESLKGMYDFVDDIVETQHVPTIQDPFDHRGRFHRCPGKRQGKAALPSTCQIFDIKELHVNHTPLLKRFVNDAGMILGRYRTGLCAKCQRKVAHTIKTARQMGLVPTISDYEIRDTGPGGIFAWAGKDGDHDAMAKAKAAAERARQQGGDKKRFGSLA